MTSDPKELIESLKNATGPDRDLDAEIHAWITQREPQFDIPAYTENLDDAITLVPEHHSWSIHYRGEIDNTVGNKNSAPTGFYADVRALQPNRYIWNANQSVSEVNAEIAICIAALSAHADLIAAQAKKKEKA